MSTITVSRHGVSKVLPEGFSWTTFIFGCWPSFFRGHWPMGFGICAADFFSLWLSLVIFVADDFLLSFLFARAWIAYWRNEELLDYMIRDGWRVHQTYTGPTLVRGNAADEE